VRDSAAIELHESGVPLRSKFAERKQATGSLRRGSLLSAQKPP
jgi:hypothetical protein